MALDVYFREDIARILGAIDVASGGTAALVSGELVLSQRREAAVREAHEVGGEQVADHLQIYRQGYQDALQAVALALGVATQAGVQVEDAVPLPRSPSLRVPAWRE